MQNSKFEPGEVVYYISEKIYIRLLSKVDFSNFQRWAAHDIKIQSWQNYNWIFVSDFEIRKITSEEKLELL